MAVNQGLEGVVVAESQLSLVDGTRGYLVYRGHWAKDLALLHTFEEVAYLLWTGHLPNPSELRELTSQFQTHRALPKHVRTVIEALPHDMDMMSVLITAVSAMGVPSVWPPKLEYAVQFAAVLPTIVTYRQALLEGRIPVEPDPDLTHVENYLYMLTGEKPKTAHVRALESYLILTMEHGLNASTFAGRVVTSTESDMASALCAALGAMKGALHGGAPSEVGDMLKEIGTIENAEPWMKRAIESGERLMGFGHRVYKTHDPRAEALREVVSKMSGDDDWFTLATVVEDTGQRLLREYKPGRKLYTNVEFWASAVLRAVQIPPSLYTPTFSISRVVGWTANILEQASHNRIIRPQSAYAGMMPESLD